MIKIELQFSTIAEAVAFLSAGHAATGTAPVASQQAYRRPDALPIAEALTKAAAEGQPAKKVKPDPTPAVTPEKTAATQPTAAVAVAVAPETKALNYAADVSPKIAAAAAKNRAGVVAALSRFGVAKGTELKPEQWGEFIVAMDAILAV